MSGRGAVLAAATALAALSAVTCPGHGVPVGTAEEPRQAVPTVALLIDDFEAADWPLGTTWTVPVDPEDPRTLAWQWAPRDCRAAAGSFSLWAVGGGERGRDLACGDPYPANVRTVAVLSLDLRPHADATVLNLAFEMWADTISDAALGDFVTVSYLHPDAGGATERVPVFDWTGATGPAFRTQRLDLLDLVDMYNPLRSFRLAGREADFEFVFRSARDSSFRPEGVFLDLVRLERDGTSPPTATAEGPPTAPATVAPTGETPQPTRPATEPATEPAPSPQPTHTTDPAGRLYLAVVKRQA